MVQVHGEECMYLYDDRGEKWCVSLANELGECNKILSINTAQPILAHN